MKKIIISLAAALLVFSSCLDRLNVPSKSLITEDKLDDFPGLTESLVLSYYPRLRKFVQSMGLERNTFMYLYYDGWFEDMTVNLAWFGNGPVTWPIGYAESQMFEVDPYYYEETYTGFYLPWDSYLVINHLNTAIDSYNKDSDNEAVRATLGEMYFIRGFLYFELVKRYGGIALFDGPFGDAPTNVRESEVASWDFVLADLDRAIDLLPETCLIPGEDRDRANKYTACALKSRAALYAACIAKYGSKINNYQGIPADRATDYFTQAAEAAKAVVNKGKYTLDTGDFSHLFDGNDENNNEIIFRFVNGEKVEGMYIWFDSYNLFGRATNNGGSWMVPTLNGVEQYETLDGEIKPLDETKEYESQSAIFDGRDKRLRASVVLPGDNFLGYDIDIYYRTDVHHADGTTDSYKWANNDQWSNRVRVPGYPDVNMCGIDGSFEQYDGTAGTTNTGFFLKKQIFGRPVNSYLEGLCSQDAVVLRLGETVLNYAEAAVELSLGGNSAYLADAQTWFDRLRADHGGLPPKTMTLDVVRHERRVDLMFENHRYWDLKRWHLGGTIDGTVNMALHPVLNIDETVSPARFYYTVERAEGHTLAGNEVRYWNERDYYCPVPVDQFPGLVQNVGWEGIPTSIYDHPNGSNLK